MTLKRYCIEYRFLESTYPTEGVLGFKPSKRGPEPAWMPDKNLDELRKAVIKIILPRKRTGLCTVYSNNDDEKWNPDKKLGCIYNFGNGLYIWQIRNTTHSKRIDPKTGKLIK